MFTNGNPSFATFGFGNPTHLFSILSAFDSGCLFSVLAAALLFCGFHSNFGFALPILSLLSSLYVVAPPAPWSLIVNPLLLPLVWHSDFSDLYHFLSLLHSPSCRPKLASLQSIRVYLSLPPRVCTLPPAQFFYLFHRSIVYLRLTLLQFLSPYPQSFYQSAPKPRFSFAPTFVFLRRTCLGGFFHGSSCSLFGGRSLTAFALFCTWGLCSRLWAPPALQIWGAFDFAHLVVKVSDLHHFRKWLQTSYFIHLQQTPWFRIHTPTSRWNHFDFQFWSPHPNSTWAIILDWRIAPRWRHPTASLLPDFQYFVLVLHLLSPACPPVADTAHWFILRRLPARYSPLVPHLFLLQQILLSLVPILLQAIAFSSGGLVRDWKTAWIFSCDSSSSCRDHPLSFWPLLLILGLFLQQAALRFVEWSIWASLVVFQLGVGLVQCLFWTLHYPWMKLRRSVLASMPSFVWTILSVAVLF